MLRPVLMEGATLILWLALGNAVLCLGTRWFAAPPVSSTQNGSSGSNGLGASNGTGGSNEPARLAVRASAAQAIGWLALFASSQALFGWPVKASVLAALAGNCLLLFGVGQDLALCWHRYRGAPPRSKVILGGLLLLLAIGFDIWHAGAALWPTPLALAYGMMALAFASKPARAEAVPSALSNNAPAVSPAAMAALPISSPQQVMCWSAMVLAGLMLWLWHGPWPSQTLAPHRIGLVLSCLYLLMLVFRFGPLMLDLAQKNNQLQRQELIDLLTAVPNQRGFFNALLPWLALARRPGNSTGLIMIDLDHLKRINDNYGHLVGDQVLRAVAGIGKNQLRDSDLIGRLGGETFAVLLPRTEQTEAMLVAERMRQAIAGVQIKAEKAVLGITASMGVTTIRPDDTTVSLIKRADDALASAKAAGRNRVMAAPDPVGEADEPDAALALSLPASGAEAASATDFGPDFATELTPDFAPPGAPSANRQG